MNSVFPEIARILSSREITNIYSAFVLKFVSMRSLLFRENEKNAISLGFTQHCLKNFVKFFILPIQLFKISFVLAKTALPHFFQNLIALPCYFFLELKHSSLARIVLWNTIWISKVLSCVLSNDEIKVRERSEEEGKKLKYRSFTPETTL